MVTSPHDLASRAGLEILEAGGTALEAAIAMGLSKYPEGSVDYYHMLVEAVKYAFLDRNRYIADPDFERVPVERLLSKAHLDALARRINQTKALAWPHVFQPGDTVYIAAVDGHPGAICIAADGNITGAHDPRSDGRAIAL